MSIIENGDEDGNDLLAAMATKDHQQHSTVLFVTPGEKGISIPNDNKVFKRP